MSIKNARFFYLIVIALIVGCVSFANSVAAIDEIPANKVNAQDLQTLPRPL